MALDTESGRPSRSSCQKNLFPNLPCGDPLLGEDDSEEDETPVVIPPSAVTIYPKGTPVPTPTVEVQVFEERVDLSNNMTWRQMIGVGVRNVVLARGELDKLEGSNYAAREGGVTQSGERSSESKADGSGVSERGRGER